MRNLHKNWTEYTLLQKSIRQVITSRILGISKLVSINVNSMYRLWHIFHIPVTSGLTGMGPVSYL